MANLLLRIAFVVLLAEVAACAPINVDTSFITGDLGEESGLASDEMLGEAESAYLSKEAGDYAGTKTKLEGELKKVEEELKKKKAQAKKEYDAQLAKFSGTFAKLYTPGTKKEALSSPLGDDGMSGMSNFARHAYTMQVASWSKKAHKKIEEIELALEENRFRHFSTAVCAEVLKSGKNAIGDLQYEAKKKKYLQRINTLKAALLSKLHFDKADMEEKVASYSAWATNKDLDANGGFMGRDPNKVVMMDDGAASKSAAAQRGELVQAAHWAYAQQRTHSYEVYEVRLKVVKKKLADVRKQHDLTLCRTGRKPQSPELKYRLGKEKKELAAEIKKLPEVQENKAEKADAKKEAKAPKTEKKEKKPAELGEGATARDPRLQNQLMFEFHKLIDASGGHETFDERAKMFENLKASARVREETLKKDFSLRN